MVFVPMVVTMVDIMARGLLMPSLRLMPRLIPLFSTATLDTLDTLPTPPMDMLDTQLTLPMVSAPMVVTMVDIMARGLLMPSLRLMPKLIPLFSTATLDTLDTLLTPPMDMLDTLPTLPTTMLPTDHSVPIPILDKKLP